MTATRYYEDLETGETLEAGTMRVTKIEGLAFARKYDPQYFHADEEAARDSVFDEVVASGIHTVAMWRQLHHQVAADMHGSAVSPRTTSVSRAQSALAPLCGRARLVSTSACRARTRSGAASSTSTSSSISATRSSSNASAPIWYHAADRPDH